MDIRLVGHIKSGHKLDGFYRAIFKLKMDGRR